MNFKRSNLRRFAGRHLALSTPRPRTRLSANLSSRVAMRRGICFSFRRLPLNTSTQPSHLISGLRQGTALVHPEARWAVPKSSETSGVLTSEAATLWPATLSSRVAMRRGICFSFRRLPLNTSTQPNRLKLQPVCFCVAQASACVPCFRRGGVYPARRRGAPSVRFVELGLCKGTASAVPKSSGNSGALAPEAATTPIQKICEVISKNHSLRDAHA